MSNEDTRKAMLYAHHALLNPKDVLARSKAIDLLNKQLHQKTPESMAAIEAQKALESWEAVEDKFKSALYDPLIKRMMVILSEQGLLPKP